MNASLDEEAASDATSLYWTPRNECLRHNPTLAEEGLYDVPASVIALLSLCYGSISVLAVAGNALVMWIVATSRRMQNVTNCFIANLALADIVIGLFAIPFQFQAALLQRWNLPHFMCAFCPFVQVLSVNVSIFTLTAIAVDRHRAILNPLSARPSKLRAKLCIAAIWGVAGALAAPIVVVQRVEFVEEFRGGRCTTKPFCTIVGMSPHQMGLYRLVLFLIQYVTPLCVISYVYARMALRLWGSRAPGNAQGSRDAALMRNKKRVIKMLVIVVAMFAFCWLPLQTYNVLQNVLPSINEYRYINIIWFCCDWLAMSNSCCNPFIYGIYNEKFKREFRQRCPFGARASSPSPITESVELDKTSLRSYDWRRGCSTRATHHHHHHHQAATAAGHVNGTPHAASRRSAAAAAASAGGAGGAAPCGPPASAAAASAPAVVAAPGVYVFPGARVRRSELHSSLEELCL